MRNRKGRRLTDSGDKYSEINSSQVSFYASITLFGLLFLINLPSVIFATNIYNVLILAFSSLIIYQAISGARQLAKLKKEFIENPEGNINKPVPKPILYRAIFWYVPK